MEEAKIIAGLIGQVGVPVVIIFWLIRYAFPRAANMWEKTIEGFSKEMQKEREYQSSNLERMFTVQTLEHKDIKECICNNAEKIMEEIR